VQELPDFVLKILTEASETLKGPYSEAYYWFEAQNPEWKATPEGKAYREWMHWMQFAVLMMMVFPNRPGIGECRPLEEAIALTQE